MVQPTETLLLASAVFSEATLQWELQFTPSDGELPGMFACVYSFQSLIDHV